MLPRPEKNPAREGSVRGFSAVQARGAERPSVIATLEELARSVLEVGRPERIHAGLTGFGGEGDALRALIAAPLGLDPSSVTIGSDMAPAADADDCGFPGLSCTAFVATLTGRSFAVPALPAARGVIVRWRVKEAGGQLRLRILRRSAAGLTAVAASAAATSPGPGVQTFATRVPVATGDLIAVDVLGGTLGDRLYAPVPNYPLPAAPPSVVASEQDWSPPLADGQLAPAPTTVFDQLESVYNADVEADADGDGFGDETQDLCAADATRQTACLSDLSVRGTATPRTTRFGRTLHYAITVRNLGAGAAESVVLTATPRTAVVLRRSRCTPAPGARVPPPRLGFLGCRFAAGRLTGSLGTLQPRASATVRFDLAAAADRSLTVRVRVASRATEAQAANDATSFSNTVRVRRGTCVNRLTGGASADTLRGTTRGDRLSGAGGADTILGRAGNDCLAGGRGRDTISAGPGNDVVDARDGQVDRVDCGPGRDTVRADRRDRVRGCERRRR